MDSNADRLEFTRLSLEMHDSLYPNTELPSSLKRILLSGGGDTKKPCFTIASRDNDIFIVVRGAAEPYDFVSCLEYDPVAFEGGYVHGGILKSARTILSQAQEYIDQCTGTIIIGGNSYGGAISTVLTAILVLEQKRKNVIGVATAPLPSITSDLAIQLEPYLTSIVYQNDVVPRLNYQTLGQIASTVFQPGTTPQQAAMFIQPMIQNILVSSGYMDQNAVQSIIQYIQSISSLILKSTTTPISQIFQCGGKIFHITKDQEGHFSTKLVKGPLTTFALNLFMVMAFIGDHSYQAYFEALLSIDDLPDTA